MKLCTYKDFFTYMEDRGVSMSEFDSFYATRGAFGLLLSQIRPYIEHQPEMFKTYKMNDHLKSLSHASGFLRLRYRHLVIFGLSVPLKDIPLYTNCADGLLQDVLKYRLERGQ